MSESSKLIMVIVTVVAIKTVLAIETDMVIVTNIHFFQNQTEYQMQETCSEVDFLAPVTKAKVVETVTSLWKRPFWA